MAIKISNGIVVGGDEVYGGYTLYHLIWGIDTILQKMYSNEYRGVGVLLGTKNAVRIK